MSRHDNVEQYWPGPGQFAACWRGVPERLARDRSAASAPGPSWPALSPGPQTRLMGGNSPHDHSGALDSSKGCVLTPLCYRPSRAYPRQWDRKEAAQRHCVDSGEGAPSRPHPKHDPPRLGWHRKRSDQRSCWLQGDLWAWLDLNQRPHPYQVSRAKRCAQGRFPRSPLSVRGEVMRS
jgi:hypothetical protein